MSRYQTEVEYLRAKQLERSLFTRRMRDIVSLYMQVSLIAFVTGGGYLVYTLLPPLSVDQRIAVMVMGASTILLLASLQMIWLVQKRQRQLEVAYKSLEFDARFLGEWERFEQVVRELSERSPDAETMNFRRMLQHLTENAHLSAAERDTLELALDTRNKLLHSRDRSDPIDFAIVEKLHDLNETIGLRMGRRDAASL